MHPELIRIITEGIQKSEINSDPLSLVTMFAIFGVISIFYGLYFCRYISYITNCTK